MKRYISIVIIVMLFISGYAYVEACWKVQAIIKLDTQSEVVETYLNADDTDMEGINLTEINVELSTTVRDVKVLNINLFYDTLAKAQAIYDYLLTQSSDMLDLDDGSKSTVCLLNTTNDISMAIRRKGDLCTSIYIKP